MVDFEQKNEADANDVCSLLYAIIYGLPANYGKLDINKDDAEGLHKSYHSLAINRIQIRKANKSEEKVHSFRPSICEKSKVMVSRNRVSIQNQSNEKKEERVKLLLKEKTDYDMANCTFSPRINTSHSAKKHKYLLQSGEKTKQSDGDNETINCTFHL